MPSLLHGLPSDVSSEWQRRCSELAAYLAKHGDAHCGFREADDKTLARWCKKQRAAHRAGDLSESEEAALRQVGFEFDGECAEWARWYNELRQFHRKHGVAESGTYTAEWQFYLTNWCSVQRIARRSRRLSAERVALLDELGFVWSGADALS